MVSSPLSFSSSCPSCLYLLLILLFPRSLFTHTYVSRFFSCLALFISSVLSHPVCQRSAPCSLFFPLQILVCEVSSMKQRNPWCLCSHPSPPVADSVLSPPPEWSINNSVSPCSSSPAMCLTSPRPGPTRQEVAGRGVPSLRGFATSPSRGSASLPSRHPHHQKLLPDWRCPGLPAQLQFASPRFARSASSRKYYKNDLNPGSGLFISCPNSTKSETSRSTQLPKPPG